MYVCIQRDARKELYVWLYLGEIISFYFYAYFSTLSTRNSIAIFKIILSYA